MMKKLVLVFVMIAALTALALPALASETGNGTSADGYTIDKNENPAYKGDLGHTGTQYTASYTPDAGDPALTANGMYLLLVVSSTSGDIKVGDITYIDQSTSDGTSVTFPNFIPRYVPESRVLLTGTGLTDGPVDLGRLVGQGVTVSGNVSYVYAPCVGAEVSLGKGSLRGEFGDYTDYESHVTAEVKSDGSFELNGVTAGETYLVRVKKDYCLTYYTTLEVPETGLDDTPSYSLASCLGNLDNDTSVSLSDLSLFLADYGKNGDYAADIDKDSEKAVSVSDLGLLLANYGKTVADVSATE